MTCRGDGSFKVVREGRREGGREGGVVSPSAANTEERKRKH